MPIAAKEVRVGGITICVPLLHVSIRDPGLDVMSKRTHNLFTTTNRSGRGHSKIAFLVEELGLGD